MLDHGVLTSERGTSSNPVDTRTKAGLRFQVVEHNGGFARHHAHVECIRHQQDKIYIIGIDLRSDEGAEYN